MNFTSVEAVANAVLFEGYILYPYRPSAIKNRQRWNFGTLYPRGFAETLRPPERWRFAAQILIEASEQTRLTARVRFVQLAVAGEESAESWERGGARSRTLEAVPLGDLLPGMGCVFDLHDLSCDECAEASSFFDPPLAGRLALSAEKIRDGVYRLSASFANETSVVDAKSSSRRSLQDVAFTSAHLLLGVENGAFVSLLEPSVELKNDVKTCVQDGVFPVLAGEIGDRSHVLCSPIILYDYPQVAPESAGDFFDGTEMDEMLALRVLTLTDDEKAEMRRSDPHACAILERTETLPNEQLLKVHGAVRELSRVDEDQHVEPASGATIDMIHDPFDPFAERPPVESVRVFGIEMRTGDRVRLWPQKKADIMDLAMEGKVAVIEAIEQDLEDNVQFAVVLEDDPGRDMGMLRQAAHRFFFSPEEVEPLGLEAG
jgi:hypothetical protein